MTTSGCEHAWEIIETTDLPDGGLLDLFYCDRCGATGCCKIPPPPPGFPFVPDGDVPDGDVMPPPRDFAKAGLVARRGLGWGVCSRRK